MLLPRGWFTSARASPSSHRTSENDVPKSTTNFQTTLRARWYEFQLAEFTGEPDITVVRYMVVRHILWQHFYLCLVQVMPLQCNVCPYQAKCGKEPFFRRVNAKALKQKISILSQILWILVHPFLEYSPIPYQRGFDMLKWTLGVDSSPPLTGKNLPEH